MKVLILSVTAGFGHHATARAIKDMMLKKGIEVEAIDVYKYINKPLYGTVDKGYLISTKYTPEVYRAMYTHAENRETDSSDIVKIINKFCSNKLEKYLEALNPDIIVCTHIFAALIVNEIKKKKNIAPTIGILTDYTIHPYWNEVPEVEYLILPNELLVYRAVKRGIAAEKIRAFGIPIHPKFADRMAKDKAREILGIEKNLPTILLMCGSMGYGNIKEIVKQIEKIDDKIQILAVCGNNHKQYDELAAEPKRNLHPFGFVDNVEVMMDASDCIVTKPGGLTLSEALAKELPMILVNPIPGQEERNAEFLLNNGMALNVTKTFPLDEAIYYIFNNKGRLQQMKESIRQVSKPNATSDIANFIIEINNMQ